MWGCTVLHWLLNGVMLSNLRKQINNTGNTKPGDTDGIIMEMLAIKRGNIKYTIVY